MPRLSLRPVHCGYCYSQRLHNIWCEATYDTPRFLVVIDVYLLVQCFEVVVFAPFLCICELLKSILRDKLSGSQVSAADILGLEFPAGSDNVHQSSVVVTCLAAESSGLIEALLCS